MYIVYTRFIWYVCVPQTVQVASFAVGREQRLPKSRRAFFPARCSSRASSHLWLYHNSSLWDGRALGKAPEATRTAWNANHVASVAAAESTRLKASDLRASSTFEPYHSTCTMFCRWPSTAVVGGKALLRNHCNVMTEIEWDEITCDHFQKCRPSKLSEND